MFHPPSYSSHIVYTMIKLLIYLPNNINNHLNTRAIQTEATFLKPHLAAPPV